MGGFLKVFDLYVKYNIHVSLAVLALVQITAMDFGIELSLGHQFIFFTAPFLGYNFIKFHFFFFNKTPFTSVKYILFSGYLSLCLTMALWQTLYLSFSFQLLFLVTSILGLLYCLPFPGLTINFRGLKGLKIHLVALSWVLTSVYLPITLLEIMPENLSWDYAFQRYLFVLAATIPFEIRDLKLDAPQLSTWPQKWGIQKTKIVGVTLLLVFFVLEGYMSKPTHSLITIFTGVLLMGMVIISKTDQSKYFSSFWVEGIPILWLTLLIIFF